MLKRLVKFALFFLIIMFFSLFYFINEKNYIKIKEIKYSFVKHPETLPKKEFIKYSTFGFSNLKADIYWLEAIQYVGGNVFGSEYKKYLYAMLDLITELNPFFEKPYIVGQLLLPNYNEKYEKLDQKAQDINIKQAEEIGLKGIKNFCDEKKVNIIKKENDLEKILNDIKYKNPCKNSNIAFQQGYIYFSYLKNPLESANFYKIASANEDSLEGARIMSAVMSGKSGDREKSIMMFLTLSDFLNKKQNTVCNLSEELQKISYLVYRKGVPLTGEIIKNLEELRKKYFEFTDKIDKTLISGDNCNNYINKAIRELNLQYIENANEKYFKKNNKNASNAKILFDEGYLDFLPTDFQQYDKYGIIYYFNEEIGEFDYKMGNY